MVGGVSRLRDHLIARPLFGVLVAALVLLGVALLGTYQLATSNKSFQAQREDLLGCGGWTIIPGLQLPLSSSRLDSVAVLVGDDIWVAGMKRGNDMIEHPLFYHWDGRTFTEIAGPAIGVERLGISQVLPITKDDVWALGNFSDHALREGGGAISTALIYHWDGKIWSRFPSPTVADTGWGSDTQIEYHLSKLAVLSEDEMWVVGSIGKSGTLKPFAAHWRGGSWEVVPTAAAGDYDMGLSDIVVLAPDNIWVVGSHSRNAENTESEPLLFHWDGNTFRLTDSPTIPVSAIAALPSGGMWAVGQTLPGAKPGDARTITASLSETQGLNIDGVPWQIVPAPPAVANSREHYISSVEALALDDVWAVDAYTWDTEPDPVTKTSIVHWDGNAWAEVQSPGGFYYQAIIGLTVGLKGDVWITGTKQDAESSPLQTMVAHSVGCSNAAK